MSGSLSCPDETELWALARGTLAAERAAELRDHIGACEACRVAVATLASRDHDDAVHAGAGQDDRYELVRLVATGGMGEVFVARDHVLGRDVAIKLLREDEPTTTRDRVLREARALAALSHPNVVAVHDQGVLEGRPFFAMELVRGKNLRQWLREDRPPRARVLDVLAQAGRGLLAAHEIGLVHSDVKPENVLVGDDGRARVTDFGLARAADAATNAQADDAAPAGTPAYMAPEQSAGGAVDARADQYAFAVMAYEALHGQRPDPSAPLPRGRRVDRALARALSRAPDDRFASMDPLVAAMTAGTDGGRISAVVMLAVAVTVAVSAAAWGFAARGRAGLHATCGAFQGACAAPLVCRFEPGDACGVGAARGVCSWPADGCTGAAAEPACGCDGVTYANACEANKKGVAVATSGACAPCAPGSACADLVVARKRAAAYCHALSASAGVCLPRPSTCPRAEASSSVCALDGRAYTSACEARRAGSDVAAAGASRTCEGPILVRDAGGATTGDAALRFSTPEKEGLDARPLADLATFVAREKLPLFSLLVAKDGAVVFELYTGQRTRDDAHYLMGATNVVTATLVGVAIDRRLVPGVDASVTDALPARAFPDDAARERFRQVTLRDVLGMAALDAPVPPHDESEASRERQRQLFVADDRAKFALSQPIVAEPGVTFAFTDVTPLLSVAVVSYATHETALDLADEALFGPMDFANVEWMHQDVAGFDNGSYGLRLRPVDMQKVGLLFLQRGVYGGRRLVSEEWMRRALSPWIKVSASAPEPTYGAGLWQQDFAPGWRAHVARGWKGQRIAVFDDQHVVVTMTAALEPPEDENAIFSRVVRDYVRPAFESRASASPDLAQALERANALPLPTNLEARMVPSAAPKSVHHPLRL